MKFTYTLGIILVALLATSCIKKCDDVYNDLKEWKIQGPVKSISETDYSNTGKYTTWLSFSSKGFVQEQASYNHDGTLVRKWKYEYNNRSQKINRSTYILNDSLSEILYYSYNANNKLAEEKLVNAKALAISIVKHEYDANRNEIAAKYLNGKGKVQGGILFKYDDKNNVIQELHYDSVFKHNVKQRKIYNQEGLNVEVLYFTMADSLLRRITSTYLPGKLLGETCIYYGQNELVSKTSYKYDEQLNVISKLVYSAEDKTTATHSFEYTYDKYMNWISRNEFIDNKPVDMITRKIDYY